MNKEFFVSRFKSISKQSWILTFIVALGIFLRTYHFKQWLQFSPDQVRDAMVINGVISHGKALPLLGTIAGGTNFHLGPMFYYFQYIAALIFENTPNALAYPDLFFSILAIPLLFLFLKKYFSSKVSLTLAALMAVSYFAVINSRFAWNPNSIPFFVLMLLYTLHEMMDPKKKELYRWPLLVGLALGVGVQLHTLLLFIMPAVVASLLVYLRWRKTITWKSVAIIFSLAIFLNMPQIVSEIETKGMNTHQFFVGSTKQTDAVTSIGSNIRRIASCQTEFNLHMISSYENKEECSNIFAIDKYAIKKYNDVPGNVANKYLFILGIVVSLLFSIGGYVLLFYYFRSEKNIQKKNFLFLTFFFNVTASVAMLPVAPHITMRYFNIVFFVPFVLVGLWGKFLLEKNKKTFFALILMSFVILCATNLFVLAQAAEPYIKGQVNDGNNSILGETKLMTDFIIRNAGNQENAYLEGEKVYIKRFFPALNYLSAQSKLKLMDLAKERSVSKQQAQQAALFYIANTGETSYAIGDGLQNCTIEDLQKFNAISLFKLKNCR